VVNNRKKHKDFKIRITARAVIDVETSCGVNPAYS
jgi:hypothetical protein